MFITRLILLLIVISLLVGGCALLPETPAGASPTPPAPQQTSSFTPQIKLPTETPTPVTPSPIPGVQLSEEDRLIFTIPNTEPWSGKEGDSRPDWKGWGAETFAIAPDGTFWIADTAVYPNRLLHYSPQGELLGVISLEGRVVYAYDLAIARDSLWLLDIAAERPKVVQLSLDGSFLSQVEIDRQIMTYAGNFIYNGVDRLMPGENGELLLHGINGYTELVDAAGETVTRPLDALAYYGHTYQTGIYDDATRRIPLWVDNSPFETSPDFYIEAPAFLGFNPDGSFTLAGYVEEADGQADFQVRYYRASGDLLGTARQRPQTFYKDFHHHLAFGQDGEVYQLLSNPDHSVQVVRLGFCQELPARLQTQQAMPAPLATLSPPDSATSNEEGARKALLAFFASASAGDYAQAAALFGGDVGETVRPREPGEPIESYWEHLCAIYWCLPVAEITATEQVSEDEFIFYTVFLQPDGTRFEIGACCGGDPAATPPVWQFAYPVHKVDGVWKVMRSPLFTP